MPTLIDIGLNDQGLFIFKSRGGVSGGLVFVGGYGGGPFGGGASYQSVIGQNINGPFPTSTPPIAPAESFPAIIGAIDGINAAFTIGVTCRKISVARNGQWLTQNVDYFAGPYTNTVVFNAGQVPVVGDTLMFLGYPA